MNPTLSHIALGFAQIEKNDYRRIVKFYEDNAPGIFSLDDTERHFYLYQYCMALFNLGRYQDVLEVIDTLIEFVFLESVEFEDGKTYELLIFKKSAALLNVGSLDRSAKVARELVRIEPSNQDYKSLFLQILTNRQQKTEKPWRTMAIILILSAAILSLFAWSLSHTVNPEFVKTLFYASLFLNSVAVFLVVRNYLKVRIGSLRALRECTSGEK